MRHRISGLAAALAVTVAAGSPGFAGTAGMSNPNPGRLPGIGAAASPFANPLAAPDASRARADTVPSGLVGGARGGSGQSDAADSGDAPRAFGEFGLPFTSTRVATGKTVLDSVGPSLLSETYPYRAIGRLDFSIGANRYICSATLIRRSVLVTAAHCVMNFGSGKPFSDWTFIPGAYAPEGGPERSPYGSWPYAHVQWPETWANGTDPGKGAARNNDLAVIILERATDGGFLGDSVGTIGYAWNYYSFVSSERTANLQTAAVSTLGYPGLFDRGRIMQRTDGPTYSTKVDDAFQLWQGSNFTGGSSGGPWIVNFRAKKPAFSGGAGEGNQARMAVIGVTSWGTADPNKPKDNYASPFRQNPQFPDRAYGAYGAGNIGALIQGACTAKVTAAKTYAQLGYCD